MIFQQTQLRCLYQNSVQYDSIYSFRNWQTIQMQDGNQCSLSCLLGFNTKPNRSFTMRGSRSMTTVSFSQAVF